MASQNVNPMTSGDSASRKTSESYETARKDTHSVTKRLKQELMSLMLSADQSVSAFPDGDNLFHWIGTITGPSGTVYEGLQYKLSLTFPSSYPYTAPTVEFETPCYHPNVDQHGNICLDTLKEKWTALLEVRTILLSIQSLLGEPNVDSPLNTHAARLWSDQQAYKTVLLDKYEKEVKAKTI